MAWQIKQIKYGSKNTFGIKDVDKVVILSRVYKDRRIALEDCYALNQRAILNPHSVRYEVIQV